MPVVESQTSRPTFLQALAFVGGFCAALAVLGAKKSAARRPSENYDELLAMAEGTGPVVVQPLRAPLTVSRARFMTWVSLACFGKLWRARSRLYQRRFLQPNTEYSIFSILNYYFSRSKRYSILCNFAPLQTKKVQKMSSTFLVMFMKLEVKFAFANSC